MKKFFYKGRINNNDVQGYLNGESFSEIAKMLESKRIIVLEIKEVGNRADTNQFMPVSKFSLKDKKEFFNSFYFQFSAGLPIIEVFDAICSSSSNNNVKALANYISRKIKAGSSLEQALRLYSDEIGYTYCVLLGAGEKTEKLQSVLSGVLKNINQLEKIKSIAIKKSTYPIFIHST